jgi:hypothetical protein
MYLHKSLMPIPKHSNNIVFKYGTSCTSVLHFQTMKACLLHDIVAVRQELKTILMFPDNRKKYLHVNFLYKLATVKNPSSQFRPQFMDKTEWINYKPIGMYFYRFYSRYKCTTYVQFGPYFLDHSSLYFFDENLSEIGRKSFG